MGCSFSCPFKYLPEWFAHFLFEFAAFLTDNFKYTAWGISTSAIKVHWAEPSGQYTLYKVKYKRHGHSWKDIRIDEQGQKSVLLTDLEPDTEYEISIKDKSLPPNVQEWREPIFSWTMAGHNRAECQPERRRLLGAQNA